MIFSRAYSLRGTNLKIKLPRNWDVQEEGNLVSVFDPEKGFGVLQFSIYFVENAAGLNLSDELRDFLEDRTDDVEVKDCGGYSYSQFQDGEDTFWRYWIFREGSHVVFASYNCTSEDAGSEDVSIDKIMKSVLG